jgi:hypothetical protein
LCEDAWNFLQTEQQSHGFVLQMVDVDQDAKLAAAYGTCVPVVTVNAKVRFRGQINRVLWARLLRAEAERRRD